MIKLKNILFESSDSPGLKIESLMKSFLIFNDRTLIFVEFDKILGVAIHGMRLVCIDGTTMKITKTENITSAQSEAVSKQSSQNRLFSLKNYFKGQQAKKVGRSDMGDTILRIFNNVVNSAKNPILICTENDIKIIKDSGFGRTIRVGHAITPENLSMRILNPAIKKLQDSKLLNKFRKFKLVSMADINTMDIVKKSPDSNISMDKYTDPTTGEESLKIYYGKPTKNLGDIDAKVLDNLMKPGFVIKDIQTLSNIFSSIIQFIHDNPDLDLNLKQANAVSRVKAQVKKDIKKNS